MVGCFGLVLSLCDLVLGKMQLQPKLGFLKSISEDINSGNLEAKQTQEKKSPCKDKSWLKARELGMVRSCKGARSAWEPWRDLCH